MSKSKKKQQKVQVSESGEGGVAKRQKEKQPKQLFTEAPPEKDDVASELIEAITANELKLGEVDDQFEEEFHQLAAKFDATKAPLFETRAALVRKIPMFWFKVIIASPYLADHIEEADVEFLQHLDDVTVTGADGKYVFTLSFVENALLDGPITVTVPLAAQSVDVGELVKVTGLVFKDNQSPLGKAKGKKARKYAGFFSNFDVKPDPEQALALHTFFVDNLKSTFNEAFTIYAMEHLESDDGEMHIDSDDEHLETIHEEEE